MKRGDILKNIFKQALSGISWIVIALIILTLIITITNLSRISHSYVKLDNMNDIQKEAFLREYGGNLTRTNLSTGEALKNNIINYYKMLLRGELGWTYEVKRDGKGPKPLGVSYIVKVESVEEIVKFGFGKSMRLLSSSMGIAIFLGIIKGVFDSKKDKKKDSTFKLFTTVIGLSIPVIFIVPVLQITAQYLRRTYGINIPTAGYETIRHTILPIIALSILPTMYIARITTLAMDKAYEDEYVRTAISKGSSKLRVMWTHVFRNSIVEVIGSLPSILAIIISDLVLVEYLFNYRGLTYMIVDYYNQGQSEAVTGIALTLCSMYLVFYALIKLVKFFIDPKERGNVI